MQSTKWFTTALLIAVAALTGCADMADDSVNLDDSPQLASQGGMTGTGGINGLNPSAYHANVFKLLSALSVPAADPNDAFAVNPAVVSTGLLDTSDGQAVFQYAARCALSAETVLEYAGNAYSGGAILSTTGSWASSGLTTSKQEEVLTCMVAHLNAFGVHVPIFLSGPSVTSSQSGNSGGFSVEEAIWQAKIPGPGQAPIYQAWPRTNLLNTCNLLSVTSWIQRVCGTPLNTCGVQVRYDQALACSGGNGNYTCNGKPAIETTLQDGALCSLFVSPT